MRTPRAHHIRARGASQCPIQRPDIRKHDCPCPGNAPSGLANGEETIYGMTERRIIPIEQAQRRDPYITGINPSVFSVLCTLCVTKRGSCNNPFQWIQWFPWPFSGGVLFFPSFRPSDPGLRPGEREPESRNHIHPCRRGSARSAEIRRDPQRHGSDQADSSASPNASHIQSSA